MHVGLNLIYLVPGETGGMETYARAILSSTADRTSPELRLTAFVNREAAEAGAGPWFDLIPSTVVAVRARRRSRVGQGRAAAAPSPRRAGRGRLAPQPG